MTIRPLCEKLDWDSEFFGKSIARALLPSAVDAATCVAMIEWCESRDVDCLYVLSPFLDRDTIAALENAAFRLIDVRLTLERPIRPPSELLKPPEQTDREFRIRSSRTADIPALRVIAGVSHRDTRFHHDGHFERERCDELYATWIEKSCRGYADHVVVAERAGMIAGYLSLHVDALDARIGLLGVDAAWRRHGIGSDLLDAGLAWLASRNVSTVSVVTPGRSVAAHSLYRKMGFKPSDTQLWYHRWFDSDTHR